jgi:hypothetical protein
VEWEGKALFSLLYRLKPFDERKEVMNVTVKQLIALLEKLPPSLQVVMADPKSARMFNIAHPLHYHQKYGDAEVVIINPADETAIQW